MKFTICNQAVNDSLTPSARRLSNHLHALPDGRLLTYHELKAQTRLSRSAIREAKARPELRPCWTTGLVQSKYVTLFGNPTTVLAYNKEFNGADD